ncbi:SixA phosphatase family protein [Pseudidiomarina sp.]|uniref:SixA phosphatase family protein n=1 Tax=Pseudidiomarina sp. TaxID=2081707 RepID=UPI003A96B092
MKSMKQHVIAVLLLVNAVSGGTSVMANEFTVYVARHAEKAVAESDPPLSEKGQKRAQALAYLLQKAELKAIYSTPYQRTQMTAQPLAESLGLTVQNYRPGDAEVTLEAIKERAENTLIVGHSNTVPALVRGLGGQSERLTEQDYGDLFQLTFYDCEGSGEEKRCQLLQTRLMVPTN